MEIKELLKSEYKWLTRCTKALTCVKVFKLNNLEMAENVDLTSIEGKDLERRLYFRYQISEINKIINKNLVSNLNSAGVNIDDYIKTYWDQIIEGFASIDENFNKAKFYKTFLSDKTSKLYRRFVDCLSIDTMKDYARYLNFYLSSLRILGHKGAVDNATSSVVNSGVNKIVFADSVLPKKWADINKMIRQLKEQNKIICGNKFDEDEKSSQ